MQAGGHHCTPRISSCLLPHLQDFFHHFLLTMEPVQVGEGHQHTTMISPHLLLTFKISFIIFFSLWNLADVCVSGGWGREGGGEIHHHTIIISPCQFCHCFLLIMESGWRGRWGGGGGGGRHTSSYYDLCVFIPIFNISFTIFFSLWNLAMYVCVHGVGGGGGEEESRHIIIL